jgi:hypothetical protein
VGGHYRALHAAAVFKLAGSFGFYAIADICLDGAVLYQVRATKPLCPWEGITEHCMRPRFSNWQASPVFTPSLTSVWMGQHFTQCTGQNPLPVGHCGALHAAAVFKLAGSPGFHAVADICLDEEALYQVHGTKPFDRGVLR